MSTSLPPHLQNLNQAQLEAVCHPGGPLLIFAGAGSGKTRVLTRRMAHLSFEHKVKPSEILAVTFTNKAADEMKRRVRELLVHAPVPSSVAPSWVATFHSICARILRHHASYLEFTPQFAIYDTSDSLSVIKRVFERLNIDSKMIEPRSILSQIDRAKNQYKFPDTIRDSMTLAHSWAEIVAEVYEAYQKELLEANAMDFGDLLCNALTLFKLEPRILDKYQEQFVHIMVDEYQDTNKVQYMLVRMLSEKYENLCVVGDDDQSIYAFRGATIENILNFRHDFPKAKTVTLEINYRSTKNILSAANAIIAKNKTRQKKEMQTENPKGNRLVYNYARDEKDEGQFLAREIAALELQGVPRSSIAIFYRTNAQSRAVEEALCELGIPYEIFGGHRFYDRREIKDILAYFRLLINERDNEAFLRIINVPARGLGAAAVGALIACAQRERLSLLPALRSALSSGAPFLSGAAKTRFQKFCVMMEELRIDAELAEHVLGGAHGNVTHRESTQAIAILLTRIADKTEYLPKLKAQDSLEAQSRVENIQELFAVAVDFATSALEQHHHVSLHHFLDRTSLSSDLDKENSHASREESGKDARNSGAISLMTLHLAKGLEFDFVFLVGLEEGILPHVRSLDDGQALEEERRLCYVGVTRARKQLYLSSAMNRHTFSRGNWASGMVSRFFYDLPQDLIEQKGFLRDAVADDDSDGGGLRPYREP